MGADELPDELAIVSAAFEVSPEVLIQDLAELGAESHSLPGFIATRGRARGWDCEYETCYLGALLNGMPPLEGPPLPSRN